MCEGESTYEDQAENSYEIIFGFKTSSPLSLINVISLRKFFINCFPELVMEWDFIGILIFSPAGNMEGLGI